MSWKNILKAKKRRSLQKVPIAGSAVRGTHGHGESKPRGSKRQQERKEILDAELRALEEDDPPKDKTLEEELEEEYEASQKRRREES